MSGTDAKSPEDGPKFGRRLALFAAASVVLHVVLLLLTQLAGLRPLREPEDTIPVQLVELEPPPEPEPPQIEPPQAEPPEPETPEPPEPEEIAPPEPQDEIAPPEPEAAEPQRAEAPAPATSSEEDEEEDATTDGAGEPRNAEVIPGIRFNRGFNSALAWFGHAVECASIELRYEEYCADVGPVYLAENQPRLAPEAERAYREMMARRNRLDNATIPDATTCDTVSDNLAESSCIPDSGPRLRDLLE